MWYSDLQKSKRHTFIASGWERRYGKLQCCCPFLWLFLVIESVHVNNPRLIGVIATPLMAGT